jgi:hypothetical protein
MELIMFPAVAFWILSDWKRVLECDSSDDNQSPLELHLKTYLTDI